MPTTLAGEVKNIPLIANYKTVFKNIEEFVITVGILQRNGQVRLLTNTTKLTQAL